MIPPQLSNEYFCKIPAKTKAPLYQGWQNPQFRIKDAETWLANGLNYGVLTGHNNLAILDDDTSDRLLHLLYNCNFPESFQVRGHIYLRLKGWDCKKIIFEDPDTKKHLGELLGKGQQGVGPDSSHPSGAKYEVVSDLPIVEIEFEDFKKVFDEVIPQPKVVEKSELPKTLFDGDKIQNLPILNVLSVAGFNKTGSGYQGAHPIHGSETGANFTVNPSQNTWYCFRCNSGGGVAEWIAVQEGIIDCSQAGKQCFSKEQALNVIEIAREKYGLKVPVKKDLGAPKGWACSVNIFKLAQRHNFTNCPECSTPFSFTESHGLYYCVKCKKGGGLKQFAYLIADKLRSSVLNKNSNTSCQVLEETK